jgi:hypothetical protein
MLSWLFKLKVSSYFGQMTNTDLWHHKNWSLAPLIEMHYQRNLTLPGYFTSDSSKEEEYN